MRAYSNWSLAEKIARLVRDERVIDVNPKYDFHKKDCPNDGLTPFDNPGAFRKKGVASGMMV